VPTGGVYEFVFPTVVGPRYSNMSVADAPASEHWVANPYLAEGESSPATFEIAVTIDGDLPIAQVGCRSHPMQVEYEGERIAHLWLEAGHEADRDVVVDYVLADETIQTGLLLYPGERGEDGFFLLSVAPPERVEPDDVVGREYLFVVDVSGSMRGFPLDVSKQLMRDLLLGLRPGDRFNILLFAGSSHTYAPASVPASDAEVSAAMTFVDDQRGGGGTEIVPALRRAFDLPREEGLARIVVVATDGYVQADADTFDVIREGLGDASLFVFGIGKSVNRHLMEGMAYAGGGEPFVVLDHGEAPARADAFREYVSSPVLTGIEVTFDGMQAYAVEPPQLPDLFADRPLTVFGRFRGAARGEIVLTGLGGAGSWRAVVDVADAGERVEHEALSLLWARHRIRHLSDLGGLGRVDEVAGEITALGLEYGLMTEYTSFVAVDSEVRTVGGDPATVIQPLQLPAGVPQSAVSGSGSRVIYRDRSEIDFDGVSVDGQLERPRGALMLDRRRPETNPLIRRRTDFDDEMDDSVDAISDLLVAPSHAGESAWVAEASVLEQLDERRDELRVLYRDHCRAHGRVRGTLEIELEVDVAGVVVDVRVLDDDLGAEALVEALLDEIASWRFGELPDAVVTSVRWSFPIR
jgi:Ca-activated chloride channel homolog